ncbi:energy-coupling factor transporter transmembrane protein EcfT [Myxococcota bacterium]|nr:energy-coupling factor transporter transmembrane protein EcfT [Myxococcota bacterium]
MPSGDSLRAGLDPRLKVAGVACASLLAVVLDSPPSLLALGAAGVASLLGAGLGRRALWAALAGGAAIAWSTVLSQALFYGAEPRTPVAVLLPAFEAAGIRFPGLAVWKEGALHGAVQALRFVGVTYAGIALAASTPPERLLQTMRRLGIPYGLAFMAATSLRFVPVVAAETWAVRVARRQRGRPLWRLGPWGWLREEVAMLRPVIGASIRRARVLAESLDVRGFDPLARRTHRGSGPMPAGQRLALGGLAGVTGAAVGLKTLWWLYLAELWYRPELRPLYGWIRAWL